MTIKFEHELVTIQMSLRDYKDLKTTVGAHAKMSVTAKNLNEKLPTFKYSYGKKTD